MKFIAGERVLFGFGAGGERKEGRTECIDVGCRGACSVELFRSHVAESANNGRTSTAMSARNPPEIDEGDGAIGAPNQVVGLDIAVNDTGMLAVQGVEDFADIKHDAPEVLFRERPPFSQMATK